MCVYIFLYYIRITRTYIYIRRAYSDQVYTNTANLVMNLFLFELKKKSKGDVKDLSTEIYLKSFNCISTPDVVCLCSDN